MAYSWVVYPWYHGNGRLMRGFANYFSDFAQRETAGALDAQGDGAENGILGKSIAESRNYVDAVNEADDFAGQFRMPDIPAMYRKLSSSSQRAV